MSFLNHLISGISLGSIYAIIALGYTMVYGIAKMLNFAHGDVIMVGGYMCFCATTYLGWPAWMGVVLAVIVCTALGVVIERLAYKPLRMAPSLAVLITAIGVSYFLQNAALLIWSSNPKTFTSVVTGEALSLFGGQLQISKVTLVAIAACVVIMVALMLFTGKSKVGTAMRAVSEDKGAAQLMGINVNTTISITFAIGSGLAAIAGVASARFRARSSAAFCSASSRFSPRRTFPRSCRTRSCSQCSSWCCWSSRTACSASTSAKRFKGAVI